MRVVVLTVDQHGSQDAAPDQVPAALERWPTSAGPARLRAHRRRRVPGRARRPGRPARRARARCCASDAWNIGIGIGEVETPLPDQRPRRSRPGVRRALARRSPPPSPAPGASASSGDDRGGACARDRRLAVGGGARTAVPTRGWEVADLVDQGLTYDEAATRLGISQSAVSQRAAAAGIVEGRRARELVAEFLTRSRPGGETDERPVRRRARADPARRRAAPP